MHIELTESTIHDVVFSVECCVIITYSVFTSYSVNQLSSVSLVYSCLSCTAVEIKVNMPRDKDCIFEQDRELYPPDFINPRDVKAAAVVSGNVDCHEFAVNSMIAANNNQFQTITVFACYSYTRNTCNDIHLMSGIGEGRSCLLHSS